MISINHLSVQFSGEPLFDHVSFLINEKDRIGLVGKNGAGKSTLLKIITRMHQPDEGEVVIPQDCTVGYLPQEMENFSQKTVLEETRSAFREAEILRNHIQQAEDELKIRTDYDSPSYHQLLRDHHDAYDRFHMIGGHTLQADIEKTLTGLGFRQEDFQRPVGQFSSGWQMRIEIAKILLQKPGLILLDEPTNHLDIESIQWLEEFLMNYPGAVILVSHDRAFLDNITTRTIEISLGKIYDYKVSYSDFIRLRETRMENQQAAYTNQQRQIRQIERFIDRFRYKASKAKQVQSRVKMLKKLDLPEMDLMDETSIHFSFPPAPHAGKIILEALHLTKKYALQEVLKDLNFHLIKGDRIAFVGRNGEGKSTLAKIIAGKLDYSGQLKFGRHVVTGYYAQDQADYFDPEKTVFHTIDDIAIGDIRPKVRTILGSFLFSGDDIDKKVKVLSGGEKSRLSLARLLLTPCNLLILDEPTNHLDIQTKDILKNALLQFSGTLVIISHDRDFLQGLTDRVYEFRDGKIKEYIGDIYDFLHQRNVQQVNQLELDVHPETGQSGGTAPLSTGRLIWEKKRNHEREIRKIQTQVDRCEAEITRLELAIRQQEVMMGNPHKYASQLAEDAFYEDYEKLKQQLSDEIDRWQSLHEQLEAMIRDGSFP